jgi:membrane-anchored protein YejM (alkaline phosphatase superfamily)
MTHPDKNPEQTVMTRQALARLIHYFFVCCYLVLLGIASGYLEQAGLSWREPRTLLFFTTALASSTFTLLLLPLILTKLSMYAPGRQPLASSRLALVYTMALVTTSSVAVLILADRLVYSRYGFHLNGFVLNLVITPGGIDSLGGNNATTATVTAMVTLLIGVHGALLWLCHYLLVRKHWDILPRRFFQYALWAFLAVTVTERLSYGISHIQAYTPVLVSAQHIPFYMPATFDKLATRFGIEVQRIPQWSIGGTQARLHYPLKPVTWEKPARPLNIVWLVVESWRWDMLDPEIMPAAWAFARQATRFTRHYSGGNATRMGMFALFYGLSGNYWFPMLDERRGPVLMKVLQEQGYQLSLYDSAEFSYPELDKTLFADLPAEQLHEPTDSTNWERDRSNVTELLKFIGQRDPAKPFMTFLFFNGTHAHYYFPADSVIRKPYLEQVNYATLNLKTDMGLLKNRYINACHHLDGQFARILNYLEEHALLDNTLVLITGDHGEEFMETGHWGHNSEFTDPQIRTPLILYVPGRAPAVVDQLSSHLDIPATLLPLLGVRNPPADYSLGVDLFGATGRSYTLVSEWSRVALIDREYKIRFPINAARFFATTVTTADDRPVADARAVLTARQWVIKKVLEESSRFLDNRLKNPAAVAARTAVDD